MRAAIKPGRGAVADSSANQTEKIAVQLHSVPAVQGWHWVRQGLNVTMTRPLGFVALWASCMLAWLFLSLVPVVGPLLIVGSMPLVWLAFMRATRLVLAQAPITLRVFADVWRIPAARRQALLKVCSLYIVTVLLAITVVAMLGPGAQDLKNINTADPKALEAALNNPKLLMDLAWLLTLMTPISILFWHAPPLVHSVGLPPGKALFFSWMACWHNRWAFAVYGLSWGLVSLTVAAMLVIAAELAGSAQLLALLSTPVSMLLGAAFYASLYFTVADCFEAKIAE